MEVHLPPDLQAQLDQIVSESGRAPEEIIGDALACYLPDSGETRTMLDARYDELKNGVVKPISGDEVRRHFVEKSAARRSTAGS